jgi:muramoyltetrapeptide carboxypeptidase
MRKIFPQRIDKNKSIGIIAPADPVAGICPKDTIQRGYRYLKQKGFSIIEGGSVNESTLKHTTSISLRVNDIHNFVKDKNIGCIMAFWGGFNTNQILDYLDYSLIKKNPKIFIGYSDITSLTTAITAKTGLVTFSGPGLISFAKPESFEYTWDYFEKTCINPQDNLRIESSLDYADDLYFLREDNNHRIKKHNEGIKIFNNGKARGEIVAGNLQTLLALNGTEFFPKLKGKILFIEEDETSTPAHVDRFICQCEQLKWFEKIKGLVFGRFTEHSQFSMDDSFEDLLKNYFSHVKFPILYNVDFGHSDPIITIPNGGICAIDQNNIIFNKSVL